MSEEDEKLQNRVIYDIQRALAILGLNNDDGYVLRKVSSTLLEDEEISINWRAAGITLVDPTKIIPIHLTPETKRFDNFSSILDAYAKMRSDGSDKLLILDVANKFLNKEVDSNGTITMDVGEVKAFGFMLVEIYKRVCLRPEIHHDYTPSGSDKY